MLSDNISDRTLALLLSDVFIVSKPYAVEFFAALNNTCISDRTIALLFLDVPSRKFFGFPYNYKTNAPLVQSIRTNKANVPADL